MANLSSTTKKAGLFYPSVLLLLLIVSLSGCGKTWTDEQTDQLKKACVKGCTEVNDPHPLQFCDCIVPKLQASHTPEALDSLTKNPVRIAELGAECRIDDTEAPAEWNEHNKATFIQSCEAIAKREGITDPTYCPCILEKVRLRYVTNTRMEGVNAARIRAIGRECIGKK